MVAGGLVLVAATTAGAVIVSQEPPPCAGAAAPMRATWDDTRRDTVRDAFVPREKADGEATFGRVVAALDEWTESWTAERTEYPRDVAEAALAHAVQGVEAVYRRSDLFNKRGRRPWASVNLRWNNCRPRRIARAGSRAIR